MEILKLNVDARDAGGKGPARQARMAGTIPGILYGGGKDPAPLTINLREFDHLVHGKGGEHAVVELQCEDSNVQGPALVKAVQHHPVRDTIMHADFQRINLDENIKTVVPIVLVGRAAGQVEGGVVDHTLREIDVECKALEVPDKIEVDITEMNIGDRLHLSDLTIPEGITLLTELSRTVATVHQPRVVEEETTTEEGVEGEEGATESDGEGDSPAEDSESSDS
jgi:large subunit ribosomal protein L25